VELIEALESAREKGFLGPGPVEPHISHAQGFLAALSDRFGLVVDLGSGAGVPGLMIAAARPDLHVLLVDSSARRAGFLRHAVRGLQLGGRAEVVEKRAEELGRGARRGTVDAVVARSFGTPAVTAECAAPLLRTGGLLVVSEPPTSADRWPPSALQALGLELRQRVDEGDYHFVVLEQVASCPSQFPRRVGQPAKRPLF
jgi:16S rRNA (guanine527-N7)-methyltransferase